MPAVATHDLVRVFGRQAKQVVALAGISLTVEDGEVFGLLGPNGAGKTTLVRILTTLLTPTSGSASVCGIDVTESPRAVRARIGLVLGGERGLYGRLSVRENLRYWASLSRMNRREVARRIDAVLETVGLTERADDLVETYSRGMVQRAHLARALLPDPDLLILDEPTSGMDPNAAASFRRLVEQLRREGKTVLLTTHDMFEAEELCSRVGFIDRGQLLTIGEPAALRLALQGRHEIVATVPDRDVARALAEVAGVTSAEIDDAGFVVVRARDDRAAASALQILVSNGARGITTRQPHLGDVYREVIEDREFTL